MSERLKRILFVVFFILFSVGVGVAIYFLFFRPATPTTVEAPVVTEPGAGLPGAGGAQPLVPSVPGTPGVLPLAPGVPGAVGIGGPAPQTVLLRDGVTQSVSAGTDGQTARYYNPEDSKFYRVNSDGVSTALSDQTFPSVEAVTWGNSTDQAILEFPDGSNVYYNFTTKKQATIPKHWEGFNFSPDDRLVVSKSMGLSPGSRYLVISNPDGTGAQGIEPLGENGGKTFPTWTPNSQIIAYATVGDAKGFDRQEIILVGQNHENFRGLQVEGRGFLPLWSPDGQTVLYSVWNSASEYRPELWMSGGDPDTVNENRVKLDVMTWADKCVWSTDSRSIYCAVPDNLDTGAGLQRELFINVPDRFIRIDARTLAKTELGKPEGNLSARNLVLTENEDRIMFSDAVTGNLYSFQLP